MTFNMTQKPVLPDMMWEALFELSKLEMEKVCGILRYRSHILNELKSLLTIANTSLLNDLFLNFNLGIKEEYKL